MTQLDFDAFPPLLAPSQIMYDSYIQMHVWKLMYTKSHVQTADFVGDFWVFWRFSVSGLTMNSKYREIFVLVTNEALRGSWSFVLFMFVLSRVNTFDSTKSRRSYRTKQNLFVNVRNHPICLCPSLCFEDLTSLSNAPISSFGLCILKKKRLPKTILPL